MLEWNLYCMICILLIDDRLLFYHVIWCYMTMSMRHDLDCVMIWFLLARIWLTWNWNRTARLPGLHVFFSKGLGNILILAQKHIRYFKIIVPNLVKAFIQKWISNWIQLLIYQESPLPIFGMREIAWVTCVKTTTCERLLCPKDPATVADGRWPDSSILACWWSWMGTALDRFAESHQTGSWKYIKPDHRCWKSEGTQN